VRAPGCLKGGGFRLFTTHWLPSCRAKQGLTGNMDCVMLVLLVESPILLWQWGLISNTFHQHLVSAVWWHRGVAVGGGGVICTC